ncbi:MAG TPA: tetratricopeptide repeat protein, partial [Myxococcaceae bacterium]
NARSDQFAFCAALYWGLYRKRPFDHRALSSATSSQRKLAMKTPAATRVMIAPGKAEGVNQLSGSALQALLKEPPRVPRLPATIRKALMRGLSMVPEERFPGMDALLAAMDDQDVVQRRRLVLVAAALAVPLLAVAGFAYRQYLHVHYCSGAQERLAGVWDAATQAEMQRGLKASGSPDAADTAAKVHDAIDRYAKDWVAIHGDACRATRVRGEQTEHVLSLRMVCLDRRLKDLKAVVGVLTAADERMVERATDAAQGLAPLKTCADVEALTNQVNMPEDPAARADIEKVGTMLAEVKALHDAGKYKQALSISREALRLAQAARFRPLEAEALYWYGWLQALSLGDAKEAERSLVQAVYAARAGRDDLTSIRASVRLVYVLGGMSSRYDDAHFWEGMIRADLERVGGNQDLESQLLSNVGSVLLLEGRLDEAQKAYERALQLAEKDGPQRATILSNLSVVSLEMKHYDEVIAMAHESLGLIARTRGPDHVSAAYVHETLSRAYWGKKEFKDAHAEIDRALAMYKRSLGPGHRQVSDGMDALAELLCSEGRFAEAVDVARRALELKEKAIGKDHPDVTYSLIGLGLAYLGAGQAAKAVPLFERALHLSLEDPKKQAEASFGLARALWATGDRTRAKELSREALTIYKKRGDAAEAKQISDWLDSAGGSGSKKTARR